MSQVPGCNGFGKMIIMQVLCRKSISAEGKNSVCCAVCGQAFDVFWERTSQTEREATIAMIDAALIEHHAQAQSDDVHPNTGFLLPSWTGATKFSAAALLGGAHGWES
jgi:hypothetical protein